MTFNVSHIRAETPGIGAQVHLLAAGSALMPNSVVDAVINHTKLEAQYGGYEAQAAQHLQLNAVYNSVATLLGAKPNEIAIMENATVAWCHAFYALPLKAGDRVLTGEAEYAANYVAFLQRAKRDGIIIDVVPSDNSGALDVDVLESMINTKTALIAMTWIPTNGGLVNPAEAVGSVAKRYNIPYLLDACQAVGQMPVNVDALNCDFLSATGRKFLRGPRGIGFLFVRESWLNSLEPAMIDHFGAPWVAQERYELRGDARRFETWENSYALRAGLDAALNYALDLGLTNIQNRSWGLARALRSMLTTVPGCQLHDAGSDQCAIVSFTVDGLKPAETIGALREKGIVIGTSKPSSTPLDAETRKLPILMRAAPHYYNTEDELMQLVNGLKNLSQ